MNEIQKKSLSEIIAEMPDDVVSLAFVYAKNMIDFSVDITEKWQTVTVNSRALQMAYEKGRRDEREEFLKKIAERSEE